MAMIAVRLLRNVGRSGSVLSNSKNLLAPAVCGGQTQTANLTSVKHGVESVPDRPLPFPYETKNFNLFYQTFDQTRERFNENTRVVLIEGNIGAGKEKFAQKFAEEFDMKYFPNFGVDDSFLTASGFDLRDINFRLPDELRYVDLRRFYTLPDVQRNLRIGRTQIELYRLRYFQYAKALQHLLSTGQGVVLNAGVWSDMVYAQTLFDFGYMTKPGLKFYDDLRHNSMCDLWKPHLIIYLDAPVAHVRKLINKGTDPNEKNSEVLTDKYIQTIEDNYKKKYLPQIQKYAEVLMYDAEVEPEWEFVVEDCESLSLDTATEDRPDLFVDWMLEHEQMWNRYRHLIGSQGLLQGNFHTPVPFEAPELALRGDDADLIEEILIDYPEARYMPGYNPQKDKYLFKL